MHARRGEREATAAWLLAIGGLLVAFIAEGVWTLVVGTASFGGDESTLVRGWEGVLRNLPAYALLVGVGGASVLLAARAIRDGCERGRAALVAGTVGLLVALASVTRDAAEVVMETRAATVSWLLFAVDAALAVGVYVLARRWARSAGEPSSAPG